MIPTRHSCPTCADAAAQGRVVSTDGMTAVVEYEDGPETVALDLVGPVAVGSVLLCHAGIALQEVEAA